ncbi:AraC family transcriptional regulator [Dyadobacter sp. LHD-138]|uniref:AraC family transcriptional regulator n=1 Tax=Dyadobacter sp. LHD-138 TaxID=3071413 RepID=UPI0027E1ADD2|nr:AraC family transcriptional regulator [Dyadobacter sp. LHD-138]MDQ6479173.1 AraC family transcriptional regulator [Dyadobacter sp. LHD-138]
MKENMYQPFEVIFKELDECPKDGHSHNFFELVYIISGTGKQCVNKSTFNYHAGHMFLITPEDCHSFDITTTTTFCFIRFNDQYIKSNYRDTDISGKNERVKKLEFILQNANHQPGCILRQPGDKALVKPMVDSILREYVNRDLYNKELIEQLVNTLIIVVARNIAKILPEHVSEGTEQRAVNILQYIHQHIFEPEKIRTDLISRHFGVSENYLGKYFKKQTGETLQQYVINYKLRMVENRLLHSEMRIGEIAAEMSFTDESHMNKLFKKYKGLTPSDFRKSAVSA